jgi:hypothetical protein
MKGQLLGPSIALVACRSVPSRDCCNRPLSVHCPSTIMWYPRYPVDEVEDVEDEEKEIVQLLTGKFDRRLIG